MKHCPIQRHLECDKNCPWWCDGEKECAIKVLALELIRRNEK